MAALLLLLMFLFMPVAPGLSALCAAALWVVLLTKKGEPA